MQCCKPFSQGTLLLLVWGALPNAGQWFVYAGLHIALLSELKFVFKSVYFALWLLLPVTGWVTDAWLGRYRAITVRFFLSMVTILMF